MATEAHTGVGTRRKTILGVIFALVLAAVAIVLIVQERVTDDPYGAGTLHGVTLQRVAECDDVWVTNPDDRHEWRTEGATPADWAGEDTIEGTLRISAEWGESTVVVGDDTVRVYGGKVSRDREFRITCDRDD